MLIAVQTFSLQALPLARLWDVAGVATHNATCRC